MCGQQVATPGLPGEHPDLGAHLDNVVYETMCVGQLQRAAQSVLVLLAPGWRGNLAELVMAANALTERDCGCEQGLTQT
jgi:hypothetical protein